MLRVSATGAAAPGEYPVSTLDLLQIRPTNTTAI